MTMSSTESPFSAALLPRGWSTIEGLVCGFGDRHARPPSGTRLLKRQVHGKDVVDAASAATEASAEDDWLRVCAEADALVAASAGLVVGVRTADCVPLLLVAPQYRWAAAVHAGWRGTVAEIASEVVRAGRQAGVLPSGMLAALGPSIGPCCYEVSAELGEEFARGGLARHSHESKPHLDLRAANRILLERSGIPTANIQTVGPCTRCARDRYHSFRAEPEVAGRQISWIGWADRKPSPDREPSR